MKLYNYRKVNQKTKRYGYQNVTLHRPFLPTTITGIRKEVKKLQLIYRGLCQYESKIATQDRLLIARRNLRTTFRLQSHCIHNKMSKRIGENIMESMVNLSITYETLIRKILQKQ